MIVFVLLPLFAVAYFWIIRLFVRNFLLAWICVLVSAGLNYTFGTDRFLLGSLHISPIELLYFCLLPAGIIRSRLYELKLSSLNLLIGGYVFLFFLSAARGLPLFGVASVGNECRGLISEVIGLTYFTTIPRDRKIVKKVVIAQIALSAVYLLVCVANYAGLPVGASVGITGQFTVLESTRDLDRALPAVPAASIGLSLLLAASWAVYRKHKRWLPLLVSLFAAAVIILQHRTVWTMVTVMILSAFFLDRPLFRYLIKTVGTVALLGVVVGLGYVSLRTRLTSDLAESATDSGTLEWRIQAWERSVEDDQSPVTFLIGQPFGFGYTRIDTNTGGYTTDVPPHNEYINQYLRVGALGTVLLILFLLRPIYGYFRDPDGGGLLYPSVSVWIIATIGVIVYGFPYNYTIELIGLVAMANGLIDIPWKEPAPAFPGRQSLALAAHSAQLE